MGGQFDKFNEQLEKEHIITRRGSIVDATFVEAPKQHNTPDENKKIKESFDYSKWQREHFNALTPEQIQKAVEEHGRKHPFKGKKTVVL